MAWLCHRSPWAEAQSALTQAVPENISNFSRVKYQGECPALGHGVADCQLLKPGAIPQRLAISALPTQLSQSLAYSVTKNYMTS